MKFVDLTIDLGINDSNQWVVWNIQILTVKPIHRFPPW